MYVDDCTIRFEEMIKDNLWYEGGPIMVDMDIILMQVADEVCHNYHWDYAYAEDPDLSNECPMWELWELVSWKNNIKKLVKERISCSDHQDD